jgi:predicted GNAT family N-acyltransferase
MNLKITEGFGTSANCYQDALKIRHLVFVNEQHVPLELEIDNEERADYFVGYLDQTPVATARVTSQKDGAWHIQRVAVLIEYRQRGFASQILRYIEQVARKEQVPYLTLGAQDQAQGFYLKLGYQVIGDGFVDAGIKHHQMNKKLQ